MQTSPGSSPAESFHELSGTIPATIGIAIAPVGETTGYTFGSWSTGVAWSTIKVPLAIAALREDRSRAEPLAVKAITHSDNGAAEQLWCQLGPPVQAARKVQAVLREGGDSSTVVESRRRRAGFTVFGQTQWALDRQARFAAQLPYLPDTAFVMDLMRQLVDEHRWGLAANGAAAKGGWGPTETGGYLVRQFGVVSGGELGVALAAETGTFERGRDTLNRMNDWLSAHWSELRGAS